MELMSKEASTLQIGGDLGEVAPAGIQDTVVVVVELEEEDSLFHRKVALIICQAQEVEAEEEGVHFMEIDTTSKVHHTEEAGNTLKVKVNTSFSRGATDHSSAAIIMHPLQDPTMMAIMAIRGDHQEEDPVEAVEAEVVEQEHFAEAGDEERTMAPILRVMPATRH